MLSSFRSSITGKLHFKIRSGSLRAFDTCKKKHWVSAPKRIEGSVFGIDVQVKTRGVHEVGESVVKAETLATCKRHNHDCSNLM